MKYATDPNRVNYTSIHTKLIELQNCVVRVRIGDNSILPSLEAVVRAAVIAHFPKKFANLLYSIGVDRWMLVL